MCSLSGDPHVLNFDGGKRWHPMHAPGHWWLVKTDMGKIMVQATYGECGLKNGGGWMRIRLNGVPRTCMTGIAIGGSFINGQTLSVEAPCDWDWENSKCRNTDTMPRVTFNGARVKGVNEGGISVSVSKNRVTVKLPESMEIDLRMAGTWKRTPFQYMNAKLFMVKGSGGTQCGHCGNFDGRRGNDLIYEQTGKLQAAHAGNGLCDAAVHCPDRLIKGDPKCQENGDGTTFTLDDCPKDIRDKAEAECRKKFEEDIDPAIAGKLPAGEEEDQLEDCILDACLDEGFVDDDAEEAAEEDEIFVKGW
eukprot:SRR837773.17333.p1 GENE.SRR837773.17333~~SRR837773.17333.p1  ORF type:complete len:355 (-),score=146.07 SRR837773.17333:98-1012(-)